MRQKSLGEHLLRYRMRNGCRYIDIQDATGFSDSTISDVISGRYNQKRMSIRTAILVCAYAEISLEELVKIIFHDEPEHTKLLEKLRYRENEK